MMFSVNMLGPTGITLEDYEDFNAGSSGPFGPTGTVGFISFDHFAFSSTGTFTYSPATPAEESLLSVQVRNLIETRYLKETEKFHLSALEQIKHLDIKARLFQSLENGYAGFEIIKNPRILTLTTIQTYEIQQAIIAKIKTAGLEDIINLSQVRDNFTVIIRLNKYIDVSKYPGNVIVLHESLPTLEQEKMEQRLDEFSGRIEAVETEVMYRPGGTGSMDAMRHYQELATKGLCVFTGNYSPDEDLEEL